MIEKYKQCHQQKKKLEKINLSGNLPLVNLGLMMTCHAGLWLKASFKVNLTRQTSQSRPNSAS